MNIVWAKNPLETRVELDDADKLLLLERLKAEHLEDYGEDQADDKWLEERAADYTQELLGKHVGDCTCVPCSCSKCYAEMLLGIDTTKGLGKHSAYKIDGAFSGDASIEEAIQKLENYQPTYNLSSSWPKEEWEKHIPRWLEEGKRAHAWLVAYRDAHFARGEK